MCESQVRRSKRPPMVGRDRRWASSPSPASVAWKRTATAGRLGSSRKLLRRVSERRMPMFLETGRCFSSTSGPRRCWARCALSEFDRRQDANCQAIQFQPEMLPRQTWESLGGAQQASTSVHNLTLEFGVLDEADAWTESSRSDTDRRRSVCTC